MTPAKFDSPVINRPYDPPELHWQRHGNRQIANAPPVAGRYPATGPLPTVPGLTLRNPLLALGDMTQRRYHLEMANDIRQEVSTWRSQGYLGATRITRELIQHWHSAEKGGLYFAQKEAILTTIWLGEIAPHTKAGVTILKEIQSINDAINDGIPRICHQMATGTGKTALMAATILWQTCNHHRYPNDQRFTNRFLAITPGITVQERLKAGLQYMKNGQPDQTTEYLNPHLNLVPPKHAEDLKHIKLMVVNYHKFIPQDPDSDMSSRAKQLARKATRVESEQQVINRVLGHDAKAMIVFNDEAHHCHQGDPKAPTTNDNSKFVWFNAMRILHKQGLIHGQVRDLSATPSFIEVRNAPLFPWIVSQYDLQEAEEAGIVKITRLPHANERPNQWTDELARSIYAETKDEKKITREDDDANNKDLKTALRMMYDNWYTLRQSENWQQRNVPPAIAVIVNSVENANRAFDYIAGWKDENALHPGKVGAELSNVDVNANQYCEYPRTILAHSKLDAPDARETGESLRYLKHQAETYRNLYPNATTADGTPFHQASDKAVLRTVLNTVGKSSQPGEQVRCVVSVGMLTEGWDTRTITHIVGFRRFGTQLLCEQVSGRALRRVAYDTDDDGYLYPEYADILGIPFNNIVIPRENRRQPPTPPPHYDVHLIAGRQSLRIHWPNVVEYRRPQGRNPLSLLGPTSWSTTPPHTVPRHSTDDQLRTASELPTGETNQLLVKPATRQEFHYLTAKYVVDTLTEVGHEDATIRRGTLFQETLALLAEAELYSRLTGPNADNQWPNRYTQEPQRAAEWLLSTTITSITSKQTHPVIADAGDPTWLDPRRLQPYQSNRIHHHVADKSETNIAVCDSGWEATVAEILDHHPDVERWIRNERLGWTIPYQHDGMSHNYEPDFVAVAKAPNGQPVNLVIEVKGQVRPTDSDKYHWMTQYWIPSVNAHPEFSKAGTWAYLYLDREPTQQYVTNMIDVAVEVASTDDQEHEPW